MLMGVINGSLPQTAVTAYSGPGDIQSFTIWSGLRAYNAAQAAATAALVDVVDQAGANSTTIHCTTAGVLDASALSAWVTAHSVTTIKVTKFYDQTTSSNHWTQATLANMPTLVANSLNTSYGMAFNGSESMRPTSAPPAQAQPYNFAMVFNASSLTQAIAAFDGSVAYDGADCLIRATGFEFFAGATLTASITFSTWHAATTLGNGSSSVINIDGTETTGNAGTQSVDSSTTAIAMILGGEGNAANYLGSLMEFGYAATTISSGNRSTLNSNMHAAYGSW